MGLLSSVVSFTLLFAGVRAVLGNAVSARNIAAFLGFSILIGILASSLTFFRLKLAVITFLAGLAVGFFVMYRSFFNGMTGWGDLVGIISLFTWVIIGLGVGLLIQVGYYLYQKYKKQ